MKPHPLQKYRQINGMTQSVLAQAVGLSTASISRIEKGVQGVTVQLAEKFEKVTRGLVSRWELLYPEEFARGRDDPRMGATPQ